MFERVKKYLRENDNTLINNITTINNSSKKINEKLMQPLYHKPLCEVRAPNLDWPGLYKKVVSKPFNAELRTLHRIKIMNDGLSFDLKRQTDVFYVIKNTKQQNTSMHNAIRLGISI